jgi:hypothetical protein
MQTYADSSKVKIVGIVAIYVLPFVLYISMSALFIRMTKQELTGNDDGISFNLLSFVMFLVINFFFARYISKKIRPYWYSWAFKGVEDTNELTSWAYKFKLIGKNTPIAIAEAYGPQNSSSGTMNVANAETSFSSINPNPVISAESDTIIKYRTWDYVVVIFYRLLFGLVKSALNLVIYSFLTILFLGMSIDDDTASTGYLIFFIAVIIGTIIYALKPFFSALRLCFNRKFIVLSKTQISIYFTSVRATGASGSFRLNGCFDPDWRYVEDIYINGDYLCIVVVTSHINRSIERFTFDISRSELPVEELWSRIEHYYNASKKNPDKSPPKIKHTFGFFS